MKRPTLNNVPLNDFRDYLSEPWFAVTVRQWEQGREKTSDMGPVLPLRDDHEQHAVTQILADCNCNQLILNHL